MSSRFFRNSGLMALTILIWAAGSANAQNSRITSRWAAEVQNQEIPLPEYPRPIMQRPLWQNLNGTWNYAITAKDAQAPSQWDGCIKVPFAVQSALSGVEKYPGTEESLWYERKFRVPSEWKDKKVLLHFGAVDWLAEVWVNDVKIGEHTGGYSPFSFEISPAVNLKAENTIRVRVWDGTNSGWQPRGKQVLKPSGIWYTAVTGIWQTVWMEAVPTHYITSLKIVPNLDRRQFHINVFADDCLAGDIVAVKVLDGGQVVATAKSLNGARVDVDMPEDVKLWSPSSPHLYDMEVELWRDGNLCDKVTSYSAMRKISTFRDKKGIMRLQLNNRDLFQFGPLDQGWWPDGLYTAPTDKALRYDIEMTKALGFNMIRKHVKVEPERWYRHCDELGMLVWQDMPSGDRNTQWINKDYFTGSEFRRSEASASNYYKEWEEIMDFLISYPSIVVWVPFNESWGQFDTEKVAEWTKKEDPSRLVNPASGGNHFHCGDMLDLHNYPNPELYMADGQRPTVLGEYGGIGWAVPGHLWEPDRNWGYVKFNSSQEVTDQYVEYANMLLELIPQAFSAAVYTQTTDVEIEVNGLMTYDRALVKVDTAAVAGINRKICRSLE